MASQVLKDLNAKYKEQNIKLYALGTQLWIKKEYPYISLY